MPIDLYVQSVGNFKYISARDSVTASALRQGAVNPHLHLKGISCHLYIRTWHIRFHASRTNNNMLTWDWKALKKMKLTGLLFCAGLLAASQAQGQELKIHVDPKGRVGFVDKNGNEVIKCQYESAQPFSNGVSIVSKSDKKGMLDVNGNVVLPLKYDQISTWTDNLYLIKKGKTFGLADIHGKIVLEPKYSNISKPNCYGKALISIGGKATSNEKKTYMANAKYGIIDVNGRILISPTYKGLFEFSYDGKQVNPYHEGRRLEFSYHYITDTLKTDCRYLGFSSIWANIYKAGIMDSNGEILLKKGLYDFVMQPQNDMVRYYIIKKNETRFGFHDLQSGQGKIVATYNAAIGNIKHWSHGDFVGGIAPVNGSSWTFIDRNFNVIRQGYKSINHSNADGLWSAQKEDGTWEVFDENNNDMAALSGFSSFLFPTTEDDLQAFVVKKGNYYGAINRQGEILIPFDYENACASSYGFVPAKKDGHWGLLTVDNREIIPFAYDNILIPIEKDAQHFWVQKSDSLYYHYNATTNSVAQKGFKQATNFENGFAHVQPSDMTLPNTQVYKSQIYLPNTAQSTIAGADIKKSKDAFGVIVNTDDIIVFDKPVSTLYVSAVKKRLSEHGGGILTETETKNILLDITRENRTYDIKTVIGEDDWDY